MINLILILATVGLGVYLFYKWATKNYDFFEKQGIKYGKPYPLLGNSTWIFTGDAVGAIVEGYMGSPEDKVVGFFEFLTPGYMLRSPDVIKQIAIKDFSHFQDHVSFTSPQVDDIFGNLLFSLKGKRWRDMRSTISPMFTGSKMRIMFDLLKKCTLQMCEYLDEEHEKNGPTTYQMKQLFTKFTNDVIATCAVGVEVNSLKNPNNEIYKICQLMLDSQTLRQPFKAMFVRLLPKLAEIFGIKLLPDEVKTTFNKLITHTMDVRKRENIHRPDVLQLLMELKDGQLNQESETDESDPMNKSVNGELKRSWTDDELMAQCFAFFIAGFDTMTTAQIYTSYELAINPDLQEQLIAEVDEVYENLNGRPISYEIITKMKYMDMFISEVLRMWPPVIATDRICVQDYTYEDEDGLKFIVQKDQMIFVPILGLHMDPKYYPDPKRFDPERFSNENKKNIISNTYLPFGVGPRNCIGFRFALMVVKTLFFHLLLNFRFVASKETEIPLKLKKSLFGLIPEKEIQVEIIPRKDKKVVISSN